MIAARQQGCAGGRTKRRGMELGVAQTVLRKAIEGRCGYRPTERAAGAEAHIVSQNKQDVWAPLGAVTSFGKSFVDSSTVRPMWPLNGGSGLGKTSCATAKGETITLIARQTQKATETPARLKCLGLSFSMFSLPKSKNLHAIFTVVSPCRFLVRVGRAILCELCA